MNTNTSAVAQQINITETSSGLVLFGLLKRSTLIFLLLMSFVSVYVPNLDQTFLLHLKTGVGRVTMLTLPRVIRICVANV